MTKILIIAEQHGNELSPAVYNTVTAATKLNGDIHVLVSGKGVSAAADKAAKIDGVSKVLKADDDSLAHHVAEPMQALILSVADDYDVIMAPATTFGKNVMPRIAAKLDVQQISDIVAVEGADTFKRPVYGGQAFATLKTSDSKKVITVRTTAFDAAAAEGGSADISDINAPSSSIGTQFVNLEEAKSDRPELTSAKVVVSGGRAFGSAEKFKMLDALADKLDAAIGASRAAVDAGYVANDYQVGQTGKVVAPDLYIAIGISGAIQHLAGMKDSKVIVAINKDEEAPIFQIADYGLVGDLFDILPELTEKL
jgi:electron transfer flavoprotein alpha subunit